jgi:hypothetical protein
VENLERQPGFSAFRALSSRNAENRLGRLRFSTFCMGARAVAAER